MASHTGNPTIDALLTLIQTSAQSAVAEYNKSGFGVPSPDSPSLHPLDSSSDVLALKKAIRILEGACERLCTTLAQPMHTIANRTMPYEAPCLRLAVEKKFADVLKGLPGLHVNAIAAKTRLDPKKVSQVLRLLATRGCFKEVSENVFTNNRLSLMLLSSNPVSATVLLNTNECLKAVTVLPEAMQHTDYAFSESVDRTAFSLSVRGAGQGDRDMSLFEWYKMNPEIGQRFDRAMTGWSRITGSISVVNNFPWDTLPQGTTFCDIGSGVGTLTLSLASAHRHLKVVLQDFPEVLVAAKAFWSAEYPQSIRDQRVDFVPLDFLKERPVAEQDVYYMKHVLHDWPDNDVVCILQNVAKAMKPDGTSRLFIHDFVLKHVYSTVKPDSGSDMSIGIERAPEPLLPNYGTGNIRHYNQDVNMLAMFNSRERTCEEYATLGEEAGLCLIKVWDLAETYMLEFKLIGSPIASSEGV
ncbi:hypothetical protein WG66_006691 [Moniliophthora roreri]|uniref:O-methyltransferase C-terminal domain-containing protein n=1 Tax=Moniliophthora roreri TaxID=221103 RepID=A0A0W0ET83_MONRR|nr:hypothetical protein WG66_006691 [Moniliophthora roreri]